MPNWYAVAKGKQPGIYDTWEECKANVAGFPYAKFRKFTNRWDAVNFVSEHSTAATPPKQPVSVLSQGVDALAVWHSECTNIIGASLTALKDSVGIIEGGVRVADREEEVASSLERLAELEALCGHAMLDLGGNIGRLRDNLLSLQPSSNAAPFNTQQPRLCKAAVPENLARRLGSETGKRLPQTVKSKIPSKVPRLETDTFARDPAGFVQVYTDGSCERNGQRGSRAGLGVWFGINHPLNLSESVSGDKSTNNVGEIQAAIRAIEVAKEAGVSKLCINTDSKFLIDSVTKWMPNWKRTGWTLSSGGPVINRKDFEALDSVSHGITLEWKYVPAHCGVLGNEYADQLAKEGALKFKRQ